MGDPQSRAREAIRKIRRQTNQLNTYSDDLELALEELGLHDWDDYDSGDERGDLPGAVRTGPNASATAAGKRAFDSDSETEPVVEAELPRDDVEQGIGSDDGGERRTMPRPPPLPPVDD